MSDLPTSGKPIPEEWRNDYLWYKWVTGLRLGSKGGELVQSSKEHSMSDRDDMRSELIQTAAVAVAIVEDLDYGMAGLTDENRRDVLHDVAVERVLQDIKWGPQHHTPMEWLAILGEEVGEACKAALESHDWPARQQRVFDVEVSDE